MSFKESWKKYSPYFIDFWHGQCPVDIEPAGADERVKKLKYEL
jgi:hypothetical protein